MTLRKDTPFRAATLRERHAFYFHEFSLQKTKRWFLRQGLPLPQLCALDAGTDTGVLKNKSWRNRLLYVKFEELPKKLPEYLPEDVYYDRNQYADAEEVLQTLRFQNAEKQELVFDIDANNIPCVHRDIEEICKACLEEAREALQKFVATLRGRYKFSKLRLVYSGRGFHVHVLDARAFRLATLERAALARQLSPFPIDLWVTRGSMRLIRLPWTLNGVVSRIAMPLAGIDDTSFRTKSVPRFLRR